MIYNPKGVGEIELNNIILDLNGTLAVNGSIAEGVKERLTKLRELGYQIILFTGDQRGNAAELTSDLGISFKKASTSEEKEALTKEMDVEKTVAIGNARIDIGTFRDTKVRIATIQAEGIHTGILEYVDILVPSINDALDLLINKNSFEATMRK
ncbi:HAD family hydrolase [Candidatus Dojkabacteria bacterium]|nr:HAD family hydrolase [Candidatus Dojkabacteria bacterium]